MGKQQTPFMRHMHVRLTIMVLALLLATVAVTFWITQRQSFDAALETTQRQNIRLASYVASMQPRDLIDMAGNVDIELMRKLADDVKRINPSLRIYVLNAKGKVIAHALNQAAPINATINLEPVKSLALPSIHAPAFPVMADDPMRQGQTGIFSAAPLGRGTTPEGYLYLMFDTTSDLAAGATPVPDTLRAAGLGMLGVMLVAAIAMAWTVRHLTRPLRQLTRSVQTFRMSPGQAAPRAGDDEIVILKESIQAMQTRIAEQFSRIENQDRVRRELISNVSHDLQTPLATMRGYLETMLLPEETPAKQHEQYLRIVLDQSTRMSKRVNSLFELSKLDAGQVVPNPETFCLADVLNDCVAGYQLQATQQNVTLHFDPGEHAHTKVVADIALLDRVLQNLIDNALRHTPGQGKIELAIAGDPIGADQQQLLVSVSNSGNAIAREHIAHLFERYWRAQPNPDGNDRQSAGLGLTIVKRILDLHGSQIRVDPESACGTRFEFTLAMA